MSKNNFSIIIPVFNEEESIQELVKNIVNVMDSITSDFEILFIDDGSKDNTLNEIKKVKNEYSNIRYIHSRKNFGKSNALNIGFKNVNKDIIITMDGDLQDDPKEIPTMLEKINEGYDLISGWKKKRYDEWHKVWPSKLFNFMIAKKSGLKLHDFNCGFKMYKKETLKEINLYGGLHRYIPILVHWKGFKVTEIEVEHHSRKYGKSKYGIERFTKGFFDFLTVFFLMKHKENPMHFFGKYGLIFISLGSLCLLYLSTLWIMSNWIGIQNIGPIGNRPLFLGGIFLFLIGLQFFSTGFISEMIVYFNKKNK